MGDVAAVGATVAIVATAVVVVAVGGDLLIVVAIAAVVVARCNDAHKCSWLVMVLFQVHSRIRIHTCG